MIEMTVSQPEESPAAIWSRLQKEAAAMRTGEALLARYADDMILKAADFGTALGTMLAGKLAGPELDAKTLRELFAASRKADPKLDIAACRDLYAVVARDPAATEMLVPFLFFKGYHALQAYRLAHWLWINNRRHLAFYVQNRISDLFAVDIHPGARIGCGIMMDHAIGIVIGETAVVEDNVSMLHAVTLGGTGKESGDRHPKIRSGVMIGAGAKILGNIEVGTGARVASGSVVLQDVPPCKTVAGVPAKVVGDAGCDDPADKMDQMLPEDYILI